MPQSWSPAGSSKIWRTIQWPGCSSMISRAGPRASAPVPISSCSPKYGPSASPGAGVPAVGGVQLAQLLVAAEGGQLDPAEQGVTDQDTERAAVGGDRRRALGNRGGRRSGAGPVPQPLPLVDQA